MNKFKSILANSSCVVLGGLFGPLHFTTASLTIGLENAESYLVSKLLRDVNRRDVVLSRREVTIEVGNTIKGLPSSVVGLFRRSKEVVLDRRGNVVPDQTIVG